jgi:hypothetical protein
LGPQPKRASPSEVDPLARSEGAFADFTSFALMCAPCSTLEAPVHSCTYRIAARHNMRMA